MAKFLVNLGMNVTVEAEEEGAALTKARAMCDPEMNIVHNQVQRLAVDISAIEQEERSRAEAKARGRAMAEPQNDSS